MLLDGSRLTLIIIASAAKDGADENAEHSADGHAVKHIADADAEDHPDTQANGNTDGEVGRKHRLHTKPHCAAGAAVKVSKKRPA